MTNWMNRNNVLRRIGVFLAAGSALALAGCNKAFTRQNFDVIRVGVDDRDDVRQRLGKPEFDVMDQWYYEDPDARYSALIHFDADGMVAGKQWMDAVMGSFDGTNPHSAPPPAAEARDQRVRTRRVDDD